MRLENNPYWAEKRTYSRFEALTYLISIANPRTKQVEIYPKALAEIWQWNKMRMLRFLDNLVKREILYKIDSPKEGGVTGVLRGCYGGVTLYGMSNLCFSATSGQSKKGGVTGVLRGCYGGVTQDVPPKDFTKNEDEDIKIIDPLSFEVVWDLYDKKTDTARSKALWEKLSEEEKKAAIEYISKYKIAQPDKRYRKNFTTFINQRAWNDELIYDHGRDSYTERQQRVAKAIEAINAECERQEKTDLPF